MSTRYLDDFNFYYSKLEALHIELCQVPSSTVRDSVKQLSHELAIIQLISMLDSYRMQIMPPLLRSNPTAFDKSEDQMAYNEILRFGNWDDLIDEIVKREAGNWTSMSHWEWIETIKKQFPLRLIFDGNSRLQLEEIIATRNILVHNRGIIDDKYIDRSKNWYAANKLSLPSLSSSRQVDSEYYKASARCVKYIIETIDQEAIKIIA